MSSTRIETAPLDAFRRWAVQDVLPLWAEIGFDRVECLFEEQLTFQRAPVRTVPRRVMVQARQISVFALAAERNWFEGRDLAIEAGRSMIGRFWAADGQDGWVFSLTRGGAVADGKRDLYTHAFVLFALAWLLRLAPSEPAFLEAVEATLRVVDRRFADARHGGHWDALPRPDALRRQNPHMHLLEALLELYDATRQTSYLARATDLVSLARQSFMEEERGTIRELFDDTWKVAPGPGQGVVEPGHQFEWAWLLRRYEGLSGTPMAEPARSLVRSALATGVDRVSGRIVDETGEDGAVRKRSSRSWPHAEAIKSLAAETALGSADYRPEINALIRRLLAVYCPVHLKGGWIDHVSETDQPVSTVMPASTLYHLMFALSEAERGLGVMSGTDLKT